jgi:hypothetical protein
MISQEKDKIVETLDNLGAEQLTQSFTTDDDFTQTNNRGA